MSTKKIIIGVLGGVTAGVILGIGLASKRSLAMRQKVMAKGDEYLSLILDKINNSKGEIDNESKQRLNERKTNQESADKNNV
ncbi:MAG: hypothetical protein RIC35_24265 [Marinoscillum sp.]